MIDDFLRKLRQHAADGLAVVVRILTGRDAAIDRHAIVAHLAEDGHLSARFAVLTALSCSIAVLVVEPQ